MAKSTGESQNDVLKALLSTPVEVPTKPVPMKRFGVDFTVQAIDGNDIDRMQERCTYWQGKGKKREKILDEQKFGSMIIVKGCQNPNWSDPALLEKYQTQDPADVVKARLLAGEIAKLAAEIMDISGFGDDEEEAEEETKN